MGFEDLYRYDLGGDYSCLSCVDGMERGRGLGRSSPRTARAPTSCRAPTS